jgi:hypothetical protein
VGRHHNEFEAGGSLAGDVAKWNFGVTDNLDIGVNVACITRANPLINAWPDYCTAEHPSNSRI